MRTSTPSTVSVLPAIAFLLVAMLSIHSGASLAKTLFPSVGATGVTALRLGFGALLLLIVFRPWNAPLGRLPWRMLLGYGLSMGLMNVLFYLALERLPLGIAVALEFTGPLSLALLGSRRPLDFAWIALAVIGILLLLPWSAQQAPIDLLGVAYALGAALCWALYIVFGQKTGAEHGTQTVALGAVIAALAVVPWSVAVAGNALLSATLLPLGLAVAVLSMALPFTLEMMAMTRLPTSTFGLLMSLEPAIGALCGMLFLHEHLSTLQWIAIASIMAATAGTAYGARLKALPVAD
ncbi:inner membrane transporter RhtA [Pseudomonas duriflava]|uniref:Inner membrane transporter RhtA n=1 Tax=Pseudomonas duriflava TaxID=459528 RepID=A0A562QL15_9PSED|nr:EamA family transporter [Pseudomonas duriflava]TWI57452.1 inner membrane transporter RhtA [Pseudomonas duriflava]